MAPPPRRPRSQQSRELFLRIAHLNSQSPCGTGAGYCALCALLGMCAYVFFAAATARAPPLYHCRLMRAETACKAPARLKEACPKSGSLASASYMPLAKSSTARQLIRKTRDKAEEVVSRPSPEGPRIQRQRNGTTAGPPSRRTRRTSEEAKKAAAHASRRAHNNNNKMRASPSTAARQTMSALEMGDLDADQRCQAPVSLRFRHGPRG